MKKIIIFLILTTCIILSCVDNANNNENETEINTPDVETPDNNENEVFIIPETISDLWYQIQSVYGQWKGEGGMYYYVVYFNVSWATHNIDGVLTSVQNSSFSIHRYSNKLSYERGESAPARFSSKHYDPIEEGGLILEGSIKDDVSFTNTEVYQLSNRTETYIHTGKIKFDYSDSGIERVMFYDLDITDNYKSLENVWLYK